MSFIPVLEYLTSYAVFGIIYWLLAGILNFLISLGIHVEGSGFNILHYYWTGSIVVFMIFSGIWLVGEYSKKRYIGEV